jgi:hypothetical protein
MTCTSATLGQPRALVGPRGVRLWTAPARPVGAAAQEEAGAVFAGVAAGAAAAVLEPLEPEPELEPFEVVPLSLEPPEPAFAPSPDPPASALAGAEVSPPPEPRESVR